MNKKLKHGVICNYGHNSPTTLTFSLVIPATALFMELCVFTVTSSLHCTSFHLYCLHVMLGNNFVISLNGTVKYPDYHNLEYAMYSRNEQ